jgi:tripartite-type tricarboxylate transporter receptor subunit TctC
MTRTVFKRGRAAFVMAAAAALLAGPATAQSYPQKPVHLIVGFAPGGVTDIAARVVGQKLSERWNQQVVIENRTGANGIVSVELVARSAADGYTLLVGTSDFATINPAAYAKLSYDPDRDFTPVAMLSNTPLVFVTSPKSGIASVKDLIAEAKAKPGQISFASPGNGSTNHLTGELFGEAIGAKLLHVPYRGGAPAAAAVAGGEVQVGIIAISSANPFVNGGSMKVLGVTSPERVPLVPDWPTLSEGGVPGFDAALWVGMWAPTGVPPAVVSKLHDDVGMAMKDKDVRDRFIQLGGFPVDMTIEQFKARMKADTARFTKVVKDAGVHIE